MKDENRKLFEKCKKCIHSSSQYNDLWLEIYCNKFFAAINYYYNIPRINSKDCLYFSEDKIKVN